MIEKRRKFTRTFKLNAVSLSSKMGSNRECAEELGIELHFIQRWRREYKQFDEGSFCGRGHIKTHPEQKAAYELEKKLKTAELRYEILKNATPYFHKGNEEIYEFIKNNQKKYVLIQMCKALGVGKKSYNIWKKNGKSEKKLHIISLKKDIAKIFARSNKRYTNIQITKELAKLGYNVKDSKVGFYMRQLKLKTIRKRKIAITTDSFHNYYVAPNVLNRKFQTDAPSKIWVSDITYIRTNKGFIYLTVIMDLFDRKIIGWNLSTSMFTEKTILPCWEMAVKNRKIKEGLIFHSDRGVQYANKNFTGVLKSYGCIPSMSRKWNSIDNAVCESFFSTLKNELIHPKTKLISRSQMSSEVSDFIENWYNKNRIHSYLNYKTIDEFIAENQTIYDIP